MGSFHAMVNEERYGDIYDAAADDFRSAGSKERFVGPLSAGRRNLGPITGTSNAGWRVRTLNLRTFVDLTQQTTFQEGKATERFTLLVSGEEARLVGYHIDSEDLILR